MSSNISAIQSPSSYESKSRCGNRCRKNRRDTSLAAMHARRIGVDPPADRLDERPSAVGKREPGGDSGREPTRLRRRLHDACAEPCLEIAPNVIRKLAPVESLSCRRGKYRMV